MDRHRFRSLLRRALRSEGSTPGRRNARPYSAPSRVKAASTGISLQYTQQLVAVESLAFMVAPFHTLTKAANATADIGLANRKSCFVSQSDGTIRPRAGTRPAAKVWVSGMTPSHQGLRQLFDLPFGCLGSAQYFSLKARSSHVTERTKNQSSQGLQRPSAPR